MNNLKEKDDSVKARRLSAEKSTTKERNVIIIILASAIIIIAGVWIWKNTEMSNVREQASLEN